MKAFVLFLSVWTLLSFRISRFSQAETQIEQRKESVRVRPFQSGDEQSLYLLFYDTVHSVNIKDYSKEQIDVWAPKDFDKQKWESRLRRNATLVAEEEAEKKNIVGFTVLGKEDYHDSMLYVHKDYLHQGIGLSLLKAREQKAIDLGMKEVVFDVSITALPFFQKHGYTLAGEQVKVLLGKEFKVFVMKKSLSGNK